MDARDKNCGFFVGFILRHFLENVKKANFDAFSKQASMTGTTAAAALTLGLGSSVLDSFMTPALTLPFKVALILGPTAAVLAHKLSDPELKIDQHLGAAELINEYNKMTKEVKRKIKELKETK